MSFEQSPTTSRFVDSAELYDAIYGFKNYAQEAEQLRGMIRELMPEAHTVLDVACGTGEHARHLKQHFAVDGVDINEKYLLAARAKNLRGVYVRADMTDFQLGREYDVVTCLFSAIGIVKTYERLERAIACMTRHVRPGGLLVVEPWFTPVRWRDGKPLVLEGQVGGDKVYRLSIGVKEAELSVLLYHYVRLSGLRIEHYSERIELGLFTRDEMTWAFEFAGMDVRYIHDGLMGRGLYIGRRAPNRF